MQVELAATLEVSAVLYKYPYDAGSLAKYTARTNKAKKMRQMKEFGCRHCQYSKPEPAIARPARNGGDPSQKRFTFDGLVSHAKEKWGSSAFSTLIKEPYFFLDTRYFSWVTRIFSESPQLGRRAHLARNLTSKVCPFYSITVSM